MGVGQQGGPLDGKLPCQLCAIVINWVPRSYGSELTDLKNYGSKLTDLRNYGSKLTDLQ